MARAKPVEVGNVCPMVSATKLLGSVWSIVIISYLVEGPKGFNELLKAVPGLNSKTLSRTLKSLQKKGLVERKIVSLQPFSVAYLLTPMAMELAPILEQLREWGIKWTMQKPRDTS
ncbi:MAG: helix-turn-helix domain-containing protein [Candidatus Caldarchaeum sp.]